MRVLALNPPYLPRYSRSQRSPAVTKSGTLYWPMWLAYGAASLERAGHDVKLVDAPAAGLDLAVTLELARQFNPELVVLDTSTPSINSDIGVAQALRQEHARCHVVMVGTHVTATAEETLTAAPAVDSIARREYDLTLVELAAALASGAPLEGIAGLSYRDRGGTIAHNVDRPYVEDLDALPLVSPTYHRHLDPRHYFNPNALYPMVAIMGSRGCPYHCSFCVYPQTVSGHALRLRSPQSIAEEFLYVQNNMPSVKAVFFEDDTFTINKKWCASVAAELVKAGNRLSFTANARADVDLETLRALKAAGCKQLCVGFESGEDGTLKAVEKKIRVERGKEFMQAARKAGVLVHGCFIFGNPGETRQTFESTLDLALQLSPDTAQFYPIMVYPGTTAYRQFEEGGQFVTHDWDGWLRADGGHAAVVSVDGLSPADIHRFCDDARRKFYLRPSYLLYKARRLLAHPREIRRTVKAMRTFYRHLSAPSQA
ncbi:MAG: radical SAM protein [Acidobacteriota bacterium]